MDPLLSSLMQQALYKCETPQLEVAAAAAAAAAVGAALENFETKLFH